MVYFKKHSTGLLLALSCTLAACSSQPSYTGNSIEQSLKQHANWQYSQANAKQVSVITDLIKLADKITHLGNELNYLLNSKQVEVFIYTDKQSATINTEATACHIVLTNLIRNAYQQTQGYCKFYL